MHVEWAVVGTVAAVLVVVIRSWPVPEKPALNVRREWTEDCLGFQHRQCQHIGSVHTFGLLGSREFVTICSCPCHWGCPSEEVSLPETGSECICWGNGEMRQENFERYAKRSTLHRVLSRWQ